MTSLVQKPDKAWKYLLVPPILIVVDFFSYLYQWCKPPTHTSKGAPLKIKRRLILPDKVES